MTNAELNALAAEKVMEWTLVNGFGRGLWQVWTSAEGTKAEYRATEWNPAEGIACAWMLVEKMREREFDVTIDAKPYFQYGCRVAPRNSFNLPDVSFCAENWAPLAITKAVLMAVGRDAGGVDQR